MANNLTSDTSIPQLEIIKGPGIHDLFDLFLNKCRGFYFKVNIPQKIDPALKAILEDFDIPSISHKTIFEIKSIKSFIKNDHEIGITDFPINMRVVISSANNKLRLAYVKNYDFIKRTGSLILGVTE
ncbi:MAG TPA: hypothetical protein DEO26_04055 [Candidatus Veblenbacteria bacterium]|nr:hypothetical protein [Candidatus Veblenbacteria bacterium]HCM45277.1 hypothetical protein [Candidatus Veblenbacteria bacterium]